MKTTRAEAPELKPEWTAAKRAEHVLGCFAPDRRSDGGLTKDQLDPQRHARGAAIAPLATSANPSRQRSAPAPQQQCGRSGQQQHERRRFRYGRRPEGEAGIGLRRTDVDIGLLDGHAEELRSPADDGGGVRSIEL